MQHEWLAATCGVGASILLALVYCVVSCRSRPKGESHFEKLTDESEDSKDIEANLDQSKCSVDESKRWKVAIPKKVNEVTGLDIGMRERNRRSNNIDVTGKANNAALSDHVSISVSSIDEELDSSEKTLL